MAQPCPGRIITAERSRYQVTDGETTAWLELYHYYKNERLPVTGDWAVWNAEQQVIYDVLPQNTTFLRRAPGPGKVHAQLLAANVDVLLIVNALNRDYNATRIRRYLVAAQNSGARPVLVLNKADLAAPDEIEACCREWADLGLPVLVMSAVENQGLETLDAYLQPGSTVALVGSSGVGKSTIANALLGEERQAVQGLRDDDRGRHTTTRRELILLDNGALLLDTPGMRELGVWDAADADEVFVDVAELAKTCRFPDCTHHSEPGCAVQAAVKAGTITVKKVREYEGMQREIQRTQRTMARYARQGEKATEYKKKKEGYKRREEE